MEYFPAINKKIKTSQTLVIAVIVILILGVFGWTIASFVSSNLQISSSLSDSQNALYLAETGSNWAAQQFFDNSSWRSSGTPAFNLPHKLGNGEYNVTCSDSATPGMVDIVSTGYIPSQSSCVSGNCRSQRTVQRKIGGASLKKLIQAGNYFDWSDYTSPSQFNGAISVVGTSATTTEFRGYDGEGDATHNQYTNEGLTDYNPNGDYGPYQPVYSSSFTPTPTRGFMGSANYPTIDMDWFKNNASNTWPSPLDRNLQISWATVSVGNMAGNQYDYAQSFTVSGTAGQRRVNDVSVLHGPSMGMLTYPKVGDLAGQEYDCAQRFYISGSSSDRTIRRVRILHGENQSTPSGRITLKIVADNVGEPDSVVIASRTYAPRQSVWNTIRFSSPVVLPEGHYWIVLDAPDQVSNRYYTIRPGDDSALANPGVMRQAINGSWQLAGTTDIAFQIERISGSPNPIEAIAISESPITLSICNDSAGIPGAVALGVDTGAPLQANYIPYSSAWCTADFAAAVPDSDDRELPAGKYWLVWDIPDQPNDIYYTLRLARYATSPTTSGMTMQRINGGSWTASFSANDPDIAFSIDTGAIGTMNIAGEGDYLYSSSPDFFSGMANEAIRNYSKANDWSSPTWAVINSVADVTELGSNTVAILDHDVIYTANPQNNPPNDWYDTDDIALIKRFTGSNASVQNWYIAAGTVFDATSGAISQTNKSFVSERDIGLVPQGSTNNIVLQANTASPRALLATQEGDIYFTRPSTSGSDTVTAQRRNLKGMVYTQDGDATFNYLWAANGTAIVGNNLYFDNYIRADYNATVVSTDGFFAASNSTWSEK